MNGYRRIAQGAVALLLAGTATSVVAADGEGRYAVRGPGAQGCEAFLTAVEEQSREALRLYAGWLEGYMSAHNRLLESTFDVVPVMSAAQLLDMAARVCRSSPELRVETAVARLVGVLDDARVQSASQPVTISTAEATINIRQEALARVQAVLAERGYEGVEATGRFNEATGDALRSYQQEHDLPVTGVPDGDTLVRLLFTNEENE
ncbi:peptidoglycan-binding domain-containing protein [Arhodomonas sp. SL1]|uniref:peptidoglycan-binding domain-containing protein n=1 Tax=Arhodomonas sp. SL1 TaxID=3425691 RepID=UPI003F8814EA